MKHRSRALHANQKRALIGPWTPRRRGLGAGSMPRRILAAALACLTLTGCATTATREAPGFTPAQVQALAQPTISAAAQPTARAIALRAAATLLPYTDPLHTFTLRRPQTWVALDARSSPQAAQALGDGVHFFEPIVQSDPDAGSSGKLWIDVLPASAEQTPRQVLLQPFVDQDYPESLLRRMEVAPARLSGAAGYRLVTLSGKTQVTLLLVRRGDRYYRVTIFGPTIPAEVAPALRTWRFLPPQG